MAVYIEPPDYLIGLARARSMKGGLYGFERYIERTQPEGARSGPGDLDLVAYSLRKYLRLVLKGHPTIRSRGGWALRWWYSPSGGMDRRRCSLSLTSGWGFCRFWRQNGTRDAG
jgi:hypothetical protein